MPGSSAASSASRSSAWPCWLVLSLGLSGWLFKTDPEGLPARRGPGRVLRESSSSRKARRRTAPPRWPTRLDEIIAATRTVDARHGRASATTSSTPSPLQQGLLHRPPEAFRGPHGPAQRRERVIARLQPRVASAAPVSRSPSTCRPSSASAPGGFEYRARPAGRKHRGAGPGFARAGRRGQSGSRARRRAHDLLRDTPQF